MKKDSGNENLLMILDENDERRQKFDALFKQRGFNVIAYATVAEIPDTLYRNIPEIVVVGADRMTADICREIRQLPDLVKVPIIAVSGANDHDDRAKAAACEVFDYLASPYSESELFAHVDNHIKNSRSRKWLRERMAEQMQELTEVQMETIIAMAELAESRDSLTANHLPRIRRYCKLIADELSKHSHFSREITREFVDLIFHASALHDIGKIGVRDGILNKYGKLTDEEFEIVASHTTKGSLTLESVLDKHPNNPFVRMSVDIVRFHHERWDGSGYPLQMAGETIPISARIMALADVYDVVRSKRSYKEARTHEEAVEEILKIRTKQLGPYVVDAFMAINEQFAKVYEQYPEETLYWTEK